MKKSSGTPGAKKAKVLSSATIYEGPVFGIRRDEVIEPSGVRTTREVITHPGSVVVLPVLPDGRILLIQQYRHAARQYLWELVAGRVDPGETPKVAAARELIEETGYRAKRFRVPESAGELPRRLSAESPAPFSGRDGIPGPILIYNE